MPFQVVITRDPVSRAWITKRSDVPGLAMHDKSSVKLRERLRRVIPYLLRINNVEAGPENELEIITYDRDRADVIREHFTLGT
jgi:hypothetical protein